MARLGTRATIAVAVALGLAGGPVQAQPAPPAEAPADGDFAERRARAQKLYDDGLAQFDTAEYLKAIDLWTEAYRILPNTPESADIKRYITNNLAVAREKQYAIDGDVRHLKRALHLAQNYRDSIDALYGDDPLAEKERARTDEFLARVQAQVDEAEQDDGTPKTVAPPPADPRPAEVDRAPPPAGKPGRGAIVAGAVLLGAGGATAVVLLAGVGMGAAANDVDPNDSNAARGKQFDRGRAGNAMAIAGAVLTPILLAAGIALVVVGTKRKRTTKVALTPTFHRAGAGLGLHARF